MKHGAKATRRPLALASVLVTITLVGCRGERERTAQAQVPETAGTALETARASAVQPGEKAEPGTEEVRLRRLWSGSGFNFYASSPSPDGRYVTEIDWTTGDLAVRDLTTGSLHRLTDKGSWKESGDYALFSIFSPAGDRVAYTWWNGKKQRHELRILDFTVDDSGLPMGSDARVAYSEAAQNSFSVFDWSEDGLILTTVKRPDRTFALALISTEDGQARVLESFDWRQPQAARSPDGRFVAYDFPRNLDDPERDIYMLSIDGGRKATLVRGPEDHRVLGWEPGGRALLFASERSNRTTLWRLPISDGAPSGSPELLRDDIAGRLKPLGFAGNAFYFGVVVESARFHVADLDLAGRRLSSAPTPLADYYGGSTREFDWSPDGRHYALANRIEPIGSGFQVSIRSLNGTAVRTFNVDGRIERLRWSPSAEEIFFYGYDSSARPHISAIDLRSGEVRTVRRFDRTWGAMGGNFALTPDGGTLYFQLLAPGAQVTTPTDGSIVALDLRTGGERAIRAVRSGGSLAVSPDGHWLAFVEFVPDEKRHALLVIPTEGGEPRTVTRDRVTGLSWTPDSRNIVFMSHSPAGRDLRIVPVDGGEAVKLGGVPPLRSEDPSLRPDGKAVAFRTGEDRGEIWAMDEIQLTSTMVDQ